MKSRILMLFVLVPWMGHSQINKEEVSLKIGKADEANTNSLKEYNWKRKSDIFVGGQKKLTTLTAFSFNNEGKLEAKIIDAQTDVKKKPGLRGRAQANAAEDKLEYAQQALGLALKYTFMTQGELLDFFSKATVTEKDGTLEATGENVYVQGDKLTMTVDAKTYLYKSKKFSSLLGKDAVDGVINYETFSSGVSHGSTTVLNMPAQKMRIDAANQDYSKRVK